MNNLHPQIIEKDLWVTTFLQFIFSLPIADKLVFKGGTSLSKVWNLIERFSEDIDLAVDRELFDFHGDLSIKQIKKLRKMSSIFVKDEFSQQLQDIVNKYGLNDFCKIESEPNGEGDRTYPEPRKIYIQYKSLFDTLVYIKSEIVLEIGSRSLIGPTEQKEIKSIITDKLPIETTLINSQIITTVPQKTFLEKVFLLHEIFTARTNMVADRKSRHLYDLERMMDREFAINAISNEELWNNILHHRQVFTRVNGVDYSQDIRRNIALIPPPEVISDWQSDYEQMQDTMIYGSSLSFTELIDRVKELSERIRNSKL
ncbi:MAG: nucleotidyl transferase AbiEii/AbiGii toxin family protein [Bacteroidales bacterium]